MKVEKVEIEGLLLIKPDIFPDERGYFFESFNLARYSEAGINENFVQDNFSKSVRGTLRGLHFQSGEFAQGKLCQVIEGEVQDVAVDIRKESPTYGKYFSVILSGENKFQLWIPPGFAHGFAVLSEEAIFSYKCTRFYNKQSERCIKFDDPDLKIKWMVENPIVSPKDLLGKPFKNFE